MTKINAQIVADSINPQGNRITTYLLTYPRFIHSELMTHRVFSRNSASSRAIPFEKMVKMVEEDPFIPIAWQKEHKGMQGNEYITDEENIQTCINDWLVARNSAIESAKTLNKGFNRKDEQGNWIQTEEIDFTDKVTKQLCNRLLEPFMWHTVLLTATEWENFFELRCPQYEFTVNTEPKHIETFKSWKDVCNRFENVPELKDAGILQKLKHNKGQAEIHMQALAEAMWDAMNESTPKELKAGEYHIPFGDKIDESKIRLLHYGNIQSTTNVESLYNDSKIKIATARCARLSYMTFDGEIDYEKDIQLHDRLLADNHMSPFEHCCRSMTEEEYHSFFKGELCVVETSDDWYQERFMKGDKGCGWCNNFKGFIQYRYMIENDYE